VLRRSRHSEEVYKLSLRSTLLNERLTNLPPLSITSRASQLFVAAVKNDISQEEMNEVCLRPKLPPNLNRTIISKRTPNGSIISDFFRLEKITADLNN
jgi:hypothetical protein